ncbi:uncharacterized protein TNCV_1775701 [Trichonephila clavipes]|nr:uncharacterized protein TNCV_1775701 [Trichonephila clavipes]
MSDWKRFLVLFFQAALARGEVSGPHVKHVKTPLKETHLAKIMPIYQRLASNELLQRCVTQNANESLHSIIWGKCSKEMSETLRRVTIAVCDAVCEFNFGYRVPLKELLSRIAIRHINQKYNFQNGWRKVFHTAEDALEYMLSKEVESDIIALPPDVVELTDEEYFIDDEMTTPSVKYLDEAHFWLNGYVNKQNCRIWSEANPQVYVETPLNPEKLTVWCALWAGGILLQKR